MPSALVMQSPAVGMLLPSFEVVVAICVPAGVLAFRSRFFFGGSSPIGISTPSLFLSPLAT